MEIFRVPKDQSDATVARLILSKGHNGHIRTVFKVEGPMAGFMEQRDYETVEQAENAAIVTARQRNASILIIEDHT